VQGGEIVLAGRGLRVALDGNEPTSWTDILDTITAIRRRGESTQAAIDRLVAADADVSKSAAAAAVAAGDAAQALKKQTAEMLDMNIKLCVSSPSPPLPPGGLQLPVPVQHCAV